MRLLFIGDIVGKPGRDLVRRAVGPLVRAHGVDFVIANGENAAGGFGITRETGDAIFAAGVDVVTTGNHVWDKREALEYIGLEPRLLRPFNYADGAPGRGAGVFDARDGSRVAVVNAMGRVHMPLVDDPFTRLPALVDSLRAETPIVFVDFHAEVTSEKVALGWHLDGRVTAVVGTHTHVQTSDARVLPGGTAYLTDAGMTGPHDSVIGVVKDAAISRFLTGLPSRFDTATGDPRLHGALIDVDPVGGRATAIEAIALTAADVDALATAPEAAPFGA
ncbi:MAG: TIGR00282 family metallophosphoesterase [Vicinamibacteraceae bacterium]|nr:TIGR00282 family metallophosphoesterase [Vicinamibacteraceae bacterium]